IYTIAMEYAATPNQADLTTTLHFNNIVQTRSMHENTWYVDGTEGSVSASQTELVYSLRSQPDQRTTIALRGSWFPEAFGGSMGELMSALAEGREPATSGRDNLQSIRLAFAAVESSETGRAVEVV
ncbi:MAG TPA: gfo/Idh/MocA family oxidoreductase, partial [Chloroflexota bacterium]|nr:gfo/Idh/MocA family oxidoreductase [Chloroflexota bacterium]